MKEVIGFGFWKRGHLMITIEEIYFHVSEIRLPEGVDMEAFLKSALKGTDVFKVSLTVGKVHENSSDFQEISDKEIKK